jgi:hypothetical protein
MAGVYSVFNIGTGHTRNEPNNTIGQLYFHCIGTKWVNDGPGGFWGSLFGSGMDSMCGSTVKDILAHQATAVNLTGHSRGGVLCHMIANDLAAKDFAGAINMVVLDPVNQSSHMEKGKELRKRMKLGAYVAVVMENVGGCKSLSFPLTAVEPLEKQFRREMYVINMPGTHGSGTQCESSAIGGAVRGIVKFLMTMWGTNFGGKPMNMEKLVEAFAKIHIESPVQYDKKGNVTKRLISDDNRGMLAKGDMTKKYQSVGRQEQIGTMLQTGGIFGDWAATDFRDTPYFFNEFHAACFRKVFPALYETFGGDKAWWATHAKDAKHLTKMNAELDRIEGGEFPFTMGSLEQLGMI